MSQVIANIFEFAQDIAHHDVAWRTRNVSFKETVESGAQCAELRVIENGSHIICAAPLYQLKDSSEAVRNCIKNFYLEKNLNLDRFYYYGTEDEFLWVRYNFDVHDDMEENIRLYIQARASIIASLSEIKIDLVKILDVCGSK